MMTHEMQILAALNLSLILQLIGLIFAVNADSYIEKQHKRLLAIIACLVFSLIIQSQAEKYFEVNSMIFPRTVASVYGYAVRPIVMPGAAYLLVRSLWRAAMAMRIPFVYFRNIFSP